MRTHRTFEFTAPFSHCKKNNTKLTTFDKL